MHVLKNKYISFCFMCLISIMALHVVFSKLIMIAPSFSPLLFPTLTIFLLVFHLFIACFMTMKYWCNKQKIYLVAIAFAFVGSAILMVGTLSSFPAWLELHRSDVINYNDSMIYFMVRNIMMAVLFIMAIVLYTLRDYPCKRYTHAFIVSGLFIFTGSMLAIAWCYSSNSDLLSIDLIDNETHQYMLLWSQVINIVLIVIWAVTLVAMVTITRLRNTFWRSTTFLCACYIMTLLVMLMDNRTEGSAWYGARLFETTATLLIIFVLLYDVFNLYRDSHLKYQQSYQNSIHDALTRLYNRSYFYDSLTQMLRQASADKPVSVIVSDLDRFKRINDNYGHLQGDRVLQFVAALLMESVRPQDIAARIGGEEFVLLLANTPSDAAKQVAERLRQKLCSYDSVSSNGQLPEQVTISMGVYTATAPSTTAEECVERADQAMYQAKENGRNQVVVFR